MLCLNRLATTWSLKLVPGLLSLYFNIKYIIIVCYTNTVRLISASIQLKKYVCNLEKITFLQKANSNPISQLIGDSSTDNASRIQALGTILYENNEFIHTKMHDHDIFKNCEYNKPLIKHWLYSSEGKWLQFNLIFPFIINTVLTIV